MIIEITVSNEIARVWKYYLGKKRRSRAKLPTLIYREIYTAVAEEAKKELDKMEAKP